MSFNKSPQGQRDESSPCYQWSLPEVKIVVIYFILASTWIVGSDMILTKSVPDSHEMGLIQSLKGLNFVITTAVLLFLVLRRAYGGWRHAEQLRLAAKEKERERFQRLSSYIQTLREEDRTRIAREIHDELGQLLTGIKMELRMMEKRIADREERSLNPFIDKLVEVSEMVDTTIGSVQRISAGLRPGALDNLGLGPALQDEAERFSKRTEISCEVEIDDYPDILPNEVSMTAFRIFQESLTNVARHAEAGHVESHLKIDENELKLEIHDDGNGFDPRELNDPKSLGLIGMLERARNVGGSVIFQRGASKGTDVILTIPLQKAGIHPTCLE
jgi:signal transduction histidine kinase